MSTAPHFDIDVPAFWHDPYPTLARMRKEAPIAFVPQLGSTLLCNRDDIFVSEKQIDVFSSHQPEGLMNKLMGHNMMRKDGDAHMNERKAIFPAVSPKTVSHWTALFAGTRAASSMIDAGRRVDFVQALRAAVLGRMPEIDHRAHQHALPGHECLVAGMIDGIANYTGDPAIEARCHAATSGIDAAIDDMVPSRARRPTSACSACMLQSDMPMESMRANIKLAITAGRTSLGTRSPARCGRC